MKTTIFCFVILLLAIYYKNLLTYLQIIVAPAKYDYFKLVQQWPPATCHPKTIKCPKGPKNWPNFTIHGLWPADYSNPYLRNCPSSTTFRSTLVQSLFPRINTSWPNLLGKDDGFWGHEWVAHGTCSESTFKVLDYFKLALDIKDRVYILKAFTDNGIQPSGTVTYGYTRVVNAIQKHLVHLKQGQVVPELRCHRSQSGAGVYLHEVGLCLDPSGNAFTSCPLLPNDHAVNLCKKGPFKLLPP